MLISNEQALTGSDYLFRATEPHLSIIILSREGVDVTFIKTLISDLNISAFPNEIYEISSMLMGSDKHLIMIKSFESAQASVNYNAILSKDLKIINELNRSSYRIMPITFENFKLFYKNQDMEGYFRFFTKNYNRNI